MQVILQRLYTITLRGGCRQTASPRYRRAWWIISIPCGFAGWRFTGGLSTRIDGYHRIGRAQAGPRGPSRVRAQLSMSRRLPIPADQSESSGRKLSAWAGPDMERRPLRLSPPALPPYGRRTGRNLYANRAAGGRLASEGSVGAHWRGDDSAVMLILVLHGGGDGAGGNESS